MNVASHSGEDGRYSALLTEFERRLAPVPVEWRSILARTVEGTARPTYCACYAFALAIALREAGFRDPFFHVDPSTVFGADDLEWEPPWRLRRIAYRVRGLRQ